MIQVVQSGTAVNNANGIQTVTLTTSVDMTKSVLIFQARSNSNRPNGTLVRGRLKTATTIEFERVTDNVPAGVVINIQWYLATFGSGVFVQRGETTQSGTTTNVAITSVTSMSQAFVLYSKTPVAADNGWGGDDAVAGELTSATQLTFRANTLNAGHIIAWQVVQFTDRRRHQRAEGLDRDDDRRDAHRDGHVEPRGRRRQDVRAGRHPHD